MLLNGTRILQILLNNIQVNVKTSFDINLSEAAKEQLFFNAFFDEQKSAQKEAEHHQKSGK